MCQREEKELNHSDTNTENPSDEDYICAILGHNWNMLKFRCETCKITPMNLLMKETKRLKKLLKESRGIKYL